MTTLKSDSVCPYCSKKVRWWHRRVYWDGLKYHPACVDAQNEKEVSEAQERQSRREARQRRRMDRIRSTTR